MTSSCQARRVAETRRAPTARRRHFNATQLLAAGVDLRTTAGRLGHGDGGATTLKVYASWTRPADQRAAELLADDLLELQGKAAEGVTPTTASGLLRVTRPIGELLMPAPPDCTYLDIAAGTRCSRNCTTGRVAGW
jgi:integrase